MKSSFQIFNIELEQVKSCRTWSHEKTALSNAGLFQFETFTLITEPYLVLLDFTKQYLVLLYITKQYLVILDNTEQYLMKTFKNKTGQEGSKVQNAITIINILISS